MPRVTTVQTSFTSGELDPLLRGRVDVKHYYNGAELLRNVLPIPQGGVRRRPGLEYMDTLPEQITRITSGVTPTAPEGGTAANANDDDVTTAVVTTSSISTTNPYVVVKYDLGSAKTVLFADVVGFTITSGSLDDEFVIQYSTDDSTWTTLGNAVPARTEERWRRSTGPVTARYWRFARVGSTDLSTATASIEEFSLWQESGTESRPLLVPFEFSTTERYLLVFTDRNARVYLRGVNTVDIRTPFSHDELDVLDFAQSLDTLIAVHEDVAPQRLVRQGADDEWQMTPVVFESDRPDGFPIPQNDFGATADGTTDEVQDIQFIGFSGGDTFTLYLEDQNTGAITYNATPATTESNIQSALRGLSNTSAGGITVADQGGDVFRVTFAGDDGGKDWPTFGFVVNTGTGAMYIVNVTHGEASGDALGGRNEEQHVEFFGMSSGDSYAISLAGEDAEILTWSNTASENADRIKAALRSLPNTSSNGIHVWHGGGNVYHVQFTGDDGDQAWQEVDASPTDTANAAITTRTVKGRTPGEDAWSATRGWPRSVVFHEGRLWFGGSRDLPDTLWGSRVSLFFDFDLGTNLADDGISITASADSVAAINRMASGRNLQIFTTSTEMFVPNALDEPITPNNIRLASANTAHGQRQQTPVVQVAGATLFLQRLGKQLREFIFSDTRQTYLADSISLLSSQLFDEPEHLAVRRATSTDEADLVAMVNAGSDADVARLAILTTLRAQAVTAWSSHDTPGASGSFKAVGVDLDTMYFATERTVDGTTRRYLERFNDNLAGVDAGKYVTTGLPSDTITGLDHLEGETVKVVADGAVQPDATVSSGQITLARDAQTSVQVGLAFTPTVTTMPFSAELPDGTILGRKKRIIEVTLELFETSGLLVDGERPAFRQFGPAGGGSPLDAAITPFTGRKVIEGKLGFDLDGQITITQDIPVDMTLLAIEQKVQV